MARTKTTRRTYTNKKLQAIGNLNEGERAQVEEPLQDVGLGQPQADCLSIAEKRSDMLPDPEPVHTEPQNSPILGCGTVSHTRRRSIDVTDKRPVTPCLQEMSPVLGCSQRNVNIHTTSTPYGHTSDNHTVNASHISPNSPIEPSSAWDTSMKENSGDQANFRPVTPDMTNVPVDEIFSPKTRNELISSIRTLFPNGPPPPPPVKPIRRPKKGDQPYIVGCNKRRRVPSPRGLSVFRGDDYGITDKTNCDEDEQCSPTKRARRGPKGTGNISKSKFNARSDEIAETLKLYEKIDRLLGRTPKEEHAGYMTKPSTSRTFSPIPSTSTDSETIMKNDKHFSESFNCDNDIFDIDDDDDLPEVYLDSSKHNREDTDRNDSPLALVKRETADFKIETGCGGGDYFKSPTPVIENDIDDGPVVLNEDLTNNNDVIALDDDYCEFDIDKYLPKEKFIITNDEIIAESKTESDGGSFMAPRVIPTTSSSDVFCIDDDLNATNNLITNESRVSATKNVSQESGRRVKSTVLRASNKMPTADETPDLVIEVPDVQAPTVNTPSQASANGLPMPMSNEDVQFVCETITNEPRPPNSENVCDVQFVGTSQGARTASLVSNDFVEAMQNIFAMMAGSPMMRPRKPAKRRSKKKKPCKAAVVNNENTAPTVNRVPVPVTTQPAPSNVAGSIPNGIKLGDCPICLEGLSSGSIASTNCGHVFCLNCIKECLKSGGKKCPTCRKQLKGAGYHQVFL